MPWEWQDRAGSRSPRRNQRRRRPYRTNRDYGRRNYNYDADDTTSANDDFDGFYDRNGDRVRLTIQTPADMLPPTRPAFERRGDWNIVRTRSRF
jgi:hypothetical protein